MKFPEFSRHSAHEIDKVVRAAHRPPLPVVKTPSTYFRQKLSRIQGLSATGRIMSMKNPSDPIGNRNRDLSVCDGIPRPTAPACACVVAGRSEGMRLIELAQGLYVYMDIKLG